MLLRVQGHHAPVRGSQEGRDVPLVITSVYYQKLQINNEGVPKKTASPSAILSHWRDESFPHA